MPDSRSLFERLTPEGQRLMPVNYRFMEPLAEELGSVQRLAESSVYHADGYCCWGFHKPISRCCASSKPQSIQEDAREEEVSVEPIQTQPIDLVKKLRLGLEGVFVLFACCVPVRGARRSL